MDQEQVHNQQLHNMQASYTKELDRADHDKKVLLQQVHELQTALDNQKRDMSAIEAVRRGMD